MLGFQVSGSFENTNSFLRKMMAGDIYSGAEALAQKGVAMLQAATPQDSGLTSTSWTYEISDSGDGKVIWFVNTNVVDGFNVAVGLQYGHGTGSGGYVPGTDFINPALKPIFDQIADVVWKEVQKA